ncbi:fimbrial biogenesis chaperone [Pseudomonas sp. 18175]|uniref:fimbrial biogenesis chaperone n=1 Tax=Pseudomonas sp. 18175 TaxID=3390056 RepID=UPI003D1FD053
MRWLSLVCLVASSAAADIVIDRTRIVYPAIARDVSITLTNPADTPRVVQAWIDNGDARLQPEFSDVPFSVTPPIVRMEPGRGQALRIVFHSMQGQAVAADRESVYWLNVLSIRPTPSGNHLSLAFRTRIKLFLRPEALGPEAKPLKWRVEGRCPLRLLAQNESAFHISLSQVVMSAGGIEYSSSEPPMIPPRTMLTLPMAGRCDMLSGPATLQFSIIDDHGITRHHEQAL